MSELAFFSVFSGLFYVLPGKHAQHADCGQIPISEIPKKCKHCYGRGWVGIDTKVGHYTPCNCVLKRIVKERVVHKEVFDIPLNPKYDTV